MARYTPSNKGGDLAPINVELEKIKEGIDDTLSRKGDAPNAMQAPLDMNGQRILNLPEPKTANEAARLKDIQAESGLPVQDSNAGKYLQTDGSAATWQQVQATDVQDNSSRTVQDTVTKVDALTVATVAEAKALQVPIETKVVTSGYYEAGDGGGNDYIVVAEGTGTDNGGSFIDMDNGNQLKGLFSSIVNVKQFGATGDSFNDDISHINSALSYCKNNTASLLLTSGQFRITSSINIPEGVKLYSETKPSGTFINQNEEVESTGSATIYVDFGGGTSNPTTESTYNDYYNASAIVMDSNTEIESVAFWYPSQSTSGIPVLYGPAITAKERAIGVSINKINLGNSYVGIDISRDNIGTNISNISGSPLYKGIILDCCIDPPSVNNVDFNGFYIYGKGSEPWPSNNLTFWIADNGFALDIGRVTWSTIQDFFAFGYRKGVNFINSSAQNYPALGRNQTGVASNCNFENIGFDSCQACMDSLVDNYKITVSNSNFVARHSKEPNNILKQSIALRFSRQTKQKGSDKTLSIDNCNFWACTSHVIYVSKFNNPKITDCTVSDLGGVTSAYFATINDCIGGKVKDNYIDINSLPSGDAAARVLISDSVSVNDNDFIAVTPFVGKSVEFRFSEYCKCKDNYSELLGDTYVLQNSSAYENTFEGNKPNNIDYFESDVESSILNLRTGADVANLQPTSNVSISGVKNYTKGQQITIRTSTVQVNLVDQDSSVPQENRLYLNGLMSSTFGDTITLISLGDLGWYEISRSIN